MVSLGLETTLPLDTLSKFIQEDIEEILTEIASLQSTVDKRDQRLQSLIEKLEGTAMKAKSKVSDPEWFADKPLALRSKAAKKLIYYNSEAKAISIIKSETKQFMQELAPIAKCYRVLNGNKGRGTSIEQYLPALVKKNFLAIEDLSQESFGFRVKKLHEKHLFSLEAPKTQLLIEEEKD
jgi:uncharacterized coiled-coil protein SlyX